MTEASKKWWGNKADLTDVQKCHRTAVCLWFLVGMFALLELWSVTRGGGEVRSPGSLSVLAVYIGVNIEMVLSFTYGERSPIFWIETALWSVAYWIAVILPYIASEAAAKSHGHDLLTPGIAIALSLAIFVALVLRVAVLWHRRPRIEQ